MYTAVEVKRFLIPASPKLDFRPLFFEITEKSPDELRVSINNRIYKKHRLSSLNARNICRNRILGTVFHRGI